MKLFFSLILLVGFSTSVFSKNIEAKYVIKGKGFTIGELNWKLQMEEDLYETIIELNSTGPLSLIYNFKGSYKSDGKIINGMLSPNIYKQTWITKKKLREVELIFKQFKLKKLKLNPIENEVARIDYLSLENYNDPLTSFINILLGKESHYTIDGRRTYLFVPKKNEKFTKILIQKYINIWADHKRNDLEYLEIYNDVNDFFPKKIKIKFKGYVFLLIKS